ncbi:MAG: AMP-binding protein [Candidatus Omnitrophota bacterium]
MNVAQVLINSVKKFHSKPAIIFRDKPISFLELYDNVFKLANGLLALGIKKADRVAIYLPNNPEYIYSYLALFSIGATVVPLDYMLTEDELVSCLTHCEAKALIAKEKERLSLENLKKRVPSLENIIAFEGTNSRYQSFQDVLASGRPLPAQNIKIEESDHALIMYTSGTTGSPKGILLNYKHLDGSPKAMEYFVDLTDKDVKISALPLSHSGGLVYIQNCICYGITLVLMERFQPLEFLRNIQKYKVTCFHLVPSMYYAIMNLKEFESFDLSSLRWVVVFGAPSDPHSLRRFQQYCPKAHLLNGWGLTETCPPNTVIPLGSKKIESIGKPAPWVEVKIAALDDTELPRGEVGEIIIKGWVVMEGYYKDPKTTAEVIKNGWFHTGDLGRFDEEGFLYIVGRKKDMIKVSGEIVYSFEVENVLLKHPSVQEAAVVGIPDKLRGEIVKAFVVLKKGIDIEAAEDIRLFCREHLAHFKVPHNVEIRESLPKTPSGKIQKETLKSRNRAE